MNSEDTKERRTLDVSSLNDDEDDVEEDFFASLPLLVSSLLRLRPFNDFLPRAAATAEDDEEDDADLVEGSNVDVTTVFERSEIKDKEEGNEDDDEEEEEDERSDSQLLKRGRESHSFANDADSDSVVAVSIVLVAPIFADLLKKVDEIERDDHEATEPAIFRIELRTKSRFLSAFVSMMCFALSSK